MLFAKDKQDCFWYFFIVSCYVGMGRLNTEEEMNNQTVGQPGIFYPALSRSQQLMLGPFARIQN